MKRYRIVIETEALAEVQEITDWYNKQKKGLGGKFQKTAIKCINSLSKDPQIYAIRYNEIRCMFIRKFPYMIHFFINNENHTVEILAVISTDRNPKIWPAKTSMK
jgi:mRNA-degrading endonuclease RelE of RelBE toxin-antitoxin system